MTITKDFFEWLGVDPTMYEFCNRSIDEDCISGRIFFSEVNCIGCKNHRDNYYPTITADIREKLEELVVEKPMCNYLGMKNGIDSFYYQYLGFDIERLSTEGKTRTDALLSLVMQLGIDKDEVRGVFKI